MNDIGMYLILVLMGMVGCLYMRLHATREELQASKRRCEWLDHENFGMNNELFGIRYGQSLYHNRIQKYMEN